MSDNGMTWRRGLGSIILLFGKSWRDAVRIRSSSAFSLRIAKLTISRSPEQ